MDAPRLTRRQFTTLAALGAAGALAGPTPAAASPGTGEALPQHQCGNPRKENPYPPDFLVLTR